jgi:hypothetical protein
LPVRIEKVLPLPKGMFYSNIENLVLPLSELQLYEPEAGL